MSEISNNDNDKRLTFDKKSDGVVVHEVTPADERIDAELGLLIVRHRPRVADTHLQYRQIVLVFEPS